MTIRIAVTLWALLALTACAKRTLHIDSEPSGALVYLNGQEVGRTPMKHDFIFYGDYDVILRKDGYETLKTHRKLNAPLYEIPPIDLFAEMLGAKDVRQWSFTMSPADPQQVDPQTLINRGQSLREDLRSSRYTRQPASSTTRPTTRPATRPATRPSE